TYASILSGRHFVYPRDSRSRVFCLRFARARRSVFLRRALRFLTLSLPWLFPIRPQHSPTCRAIAIQRRFEFVSFTQLSLGFLLPGLHYRACHLPARSISLPRIRASESANPVPTISLSEC